MRNKLYTFKNDLKNRLKNKEFKKAWQESQVEYELGRELIARRLASKMSQRDLAKAAKTTQAVISRIESMNANPSLLLLKRIGEALRAKVKIQFA